ncbi:MAG: CRISPR-associated endonuclease Cas2 [Candidatus Limimorpha sp.]|uniref:CRISPR-associated endonuclease Cas2 n=1 Tax=Prevotella heparinolytica TaxID=28113 RepID=UPI0035A15191
MVKRISARKLFIVVAYDIVDDKRRNRVVKLLEANGTRVNYSVFECMLTEAAYGRLRRKIGEIVDDRQDSVIYYPVCVNCYTKIVYQPDRREPPDTVRMV